MSKVAEPRLLMRPSSSSPQHSAALPEAHRAGPARLRDLIAHHYFAIDPEIIWDAATFHVPALLAAGLHLQREADADADADADGG